jgi:3-hydroxyacyl-[acyl-carrier-protein] dehydratase
MAQAGGLLAYTLLPQTQGQAVYFMGMDKVKFRKPVRPGDQLVLKIKLLRQRGPIFKMKGEAFVDEQLVAEGELMATTDPGKSDAEN